MALGFCFYLIDLLISFWFADMVSLFITFWKTKSNIISYFFRSDGICKEELILTKRPSSNTFCAGGTFIKFLTNMLKKERLSIR